MEEYDKIKAKPLQRLPRTTYPHPKVKNRSQSVFIASEEMEEKFRRRSNSWPSVSSESHTSDDSFEKISGERNNKQVLSIITNIAHVVIGIAVVQLGIAGTWYQRYMNFPKDQLRHVVYICMLFIVLGVYGMCIVVKKLASIRAHRIAYSVLSSLNVVASCFIVANSIRILVSDQYRSSQTVVVIFDGLMLAFSGIEAIVTFIAMYVTVPKPSSEIESYIEKSVSGTKHRESTNDARSWCSIFSIILNVAHLVLGLCIIELGLVGMLYRNVMNIDNTGLFAIVFISMSFITAGIIGIYNQMTEKGLITCNRSMYTIASALAAGCATVIMSFVSVAMSSNQYYTGIEAIVAFDVMILSMSSLELVVAVAAIALCLVPLCLSRLRQEH